MDVPRHPINPGGYGTVPVLPKYNVPFLPQPCRFTFTAVNMHQLQYVTESLHVIREVSNYTRRRNAVYLLFA